MVAYGLDIQNGVSLDVKASGGFQYFLAHSLPRTGREGILCVGDHRAKKRSWGAGEVAQWLLLLQRSQDQFPGYT